MAKFCGQCGAGLNDSATFCGACGAAQAKPSTSPPVSSISTSQSEPVKKSNTGLKIVVGLLAIIFVGGAFALGGTIYLAHKASERARAFERQVLGPDSSSPAGGIASMVAKAGGGSDEANAEVKGDPCRFLSVGDVSQAVGITVTRAEAKDSGCNYYAKGDPADMTSKHMAAMVSSQAASKGETIPPEQKKMMQQITGAFFKQQEAGDKDLAAQAATGEVPVVSVSFSTGNADLEMKMTKAAFNHIAGGGPTAGGDASTLQTATGDLSGIGDEAYMMGGSGLIVRKGKTVIHFMFPQCPCGIEAVKPLAQRLASQL